MAANKYDANSISILEGLEAVRMRPGMYIGSVGTKGLNHLIYEIADNSVDEHLAGACDTIRVTLEADGSCTVEDNEQQLSRIMDEVFLSESILKPEYLRLRLYLQYFMQAASSEMEDIRYQADFTVLERL